MSAELLGLLVTNTSASTTKFTGAPSDDKKSLQAATNSAAIGNEADKGSPISCASTRTSSPGSSSSSSSCEDSALVTAALSQRSSSMSSTLNEVETLAQRRRVRELVLNDLGIDLPETTTTEKVTVTAAAAFPPATKKHAADSLSACPAKIPPCFTAPKTPPVPAYTACVAKAPSCRVVRVAASALSDVISTSPACDSVTAARSGGDASQRAIPKQVRLPPAQPLGDVALRTPANGTSPPLSIVSTKPAAARSSTPGNDASTRTPVACHDVNPPIDVTSPPMSIVSTKPATLMSSTPSRDASMRTPMAPPRTPVAPPLEVTTPPLSVVSTRPATSTSTTLSQDASTRTPMPCPDVKPPIEIASPPLSVVSTRPAQTSTTPSQDASTRTPAAACARLKTPAGSTATGSLSPNCPGGIQIMQGSTYQEQSWLLVGVELSNEEMAEKLRAAAPEIYED